MLELTGKKGHRGKETWLNLVRTLKCFLKKYFLENTFGLLVNENFFVAPRSLFPRSLYQQFPFSVMQFV